MTKPEIRSGTPPDPRDSWGPIFDKMKVGDFFYWNKRKEPSIRSAFRYWQSRQPERQKLRLSIRVDDHYTSKIVVWMLAAK